MTKEKHQIKADIRTVLGRKVKHIRKEGLMPATVYGHKFETMSIQFNMVEVEKLYNEVGESGLVELLVGEEKLPILFRNPQYSAIKSDIIHIDCYKVNLKEKITAPVPIELIGESQAVKDGNMLVEITNEVEVEALPTDLPEGFVVDISTLVAVGDMITVGDIKLDSEKVTMVTHADQVIVKIEEPRAEEVIEVPEAEVAPGEVPATEQKSEEEIAAEGEAEKTEEKE